MRGEPQPIPCGLQLLLRGIEAVDGEAGVAEARGATGAKSGYVILSVEAGVELRGYSFCKLGEVESQVRQCVAVLRGFFYEERAETPVVEQIVALEQRDVTLVGLRGAEQLGEEVVPGDDPRAHPRVGMLQNFEPAVELAERRLADRAPRGTRADGSGFALGSFIQVERGREWCVVLVRLL